MTERSRVVFVDLLRIVATFQMVQGHTIDALLDHQARHGPIYEVWEWLRGLTAVAFFTAMGMAFAITTEPRDQARVRARLGRAAFLVAVGYVLRAPLGALFGDPHAIDAFLAIDVLHCIGVTLALIAAMYAVLPTRGAIAIAAGLLALACFWFGHGVASSEIEGPRPLVAYLTEQYGSVFPLLPWAGFGLAGVAVARVALPEGASTPRRTTAIRLGVLALASIAIGVTRPASGGIPDFAECLLRLGAVLVVAAVLAVLSEDVARLPPWLETLAGETLFVYGFHVLVVYGAAVSLGALIGPRLSPVPAAIVALAVMAISAGLALVYANKLKGRSLAGRPPKR